MSDVSDYEARFKAAVEDLGRRKGGLMVGDTFVVDGVTFGIADYGDGSLVFERVSVLKQGQPT